MKEITPPEGYNPHTTVYNLSELDGNTITVQYTTVDRTIKNDVIKGRVAITKLLSSKRFPGLMKPEEGVTFEVYLTSAGSYAAAKDSEKQTITTDADGYAETKSLPYGVYTVHQVNTTTGYEMIPDFEVVISEHNKTYRYTLNDKEYEADLRVTKADSETGKVIPVSGATFKVRKAGTGEWLSFVVNYPTVHTVTEFVTDESGTFQLPEKLPYGSYELVEIAAPSGYLFSDAPVPFTVDGSKSIIELTVENDPQKGVIEVVKTGEVLKSVTANADGTYTPVFGEAPIKGIVFDIFAKTDIVTPDGTKKYAAGEKVDTVTTNASGTATSKALYLGQYEVKEVTAGENHVLNTKVFDAELTYDAGKVQVTETVAVKNDRQKASVTLKKNLETDSLFKYGKDKHKDIVFGIYADEIITAENGTSIPKGGLIQAIGVSEDGSAYSGSFTCDLPHGSFYVKEMETAEGYILGDTKYAVTFDYKDQTVKTVNIAVNNGNAIDNEIMRSDIEGLKVSESDVKLSGALIGLFWEGETDFTESNAILTDISDENGAFAFKDVAYGKYIVREIRQPIGYVLSETSYPVNVDGDGKVIPVKVQNEVTKFDIAKTDIATGDYVVGAQLSIIPLDEDGNPDVGATFETWITEDKEHRVEGLEVGKTYILREKLTGKAWDYGYVTAEDIKFTVPDTGKVQKIEMKDDFTKVDIAKTDIATGDYVVGAQLTIYPVNALGFPKLGEAFETWITEDKEHRVEHLPVGDYILRETLTGEAWDYGYVTAEDVKFTVSDTGVVQKVEMKDDFTKVDIAKTDIVTGDYVVGTQLAIIPLDEHGKPDVGATFETWITEDKEHRVERIPVGDYILRETLTGEAWDYGYVTAEDVKFTVSDTPDVQKVEMKDDFTKLEVTKTNIMTGEPVVGTQLSLIPLDEDGNPDIGATFDTWITDGTPHYIERIPVGEYILREKLTGQAWTYGYVTADDVKFTVSDTPKLQTVEMNDDYTKIEIIKTDIETGKPVVGTQLSLIPLDENGNPDVGATFDTWITEETAHHMEYVPVGEYIIRETLTGKAWDYGYVTADDMKITVKDVETLQTFEMKDDFTKVDIAKTDIATGEYVVGAQLAIIPLDEDGNPDVGATFETWITEDKEHHVERIPVGTYILREKLTGKAWDYGYVTAEDVKFTVSDTPDVQKVEMKDDFTKVEITKTDITTGEPVIGAQLSIIPLGENGEPKVGETFDTWITDEDPHYIERIPVGKYILRETLTGQAWDYGYVTAEDVIFTVEDTPEIQKVDMDDDYTKVEITKTDITTGEPVVGTQLSLIPLDENGKPKAGETFDTWITDDKAHYMEYVPVGEYIVRETLSGEAWDCGYVTAADMKISVKDTGKVQEFNMEDDYTKIEITKTDIKTGEPVVGTQLSLIPLDENGKPKAGETFDTWITDDKAHYMEYVPVGQYIVREKLTGQAWDYGYVTAEDLVITVKDTAEVQKFDMDDDYTKLEITKTDITTRKPIIGAQLAIIPLDENGNPDIGATFDTWLTEEDPHYIERIPVGEYILREKLTGQAWEYGYVTAEDVRFTVADTPEVQKVEMNDDYTKIEISKTDITTGEPVIGAQLSIIPLDENGEPKVGETFDTWITDENPHMVEYLPVGEYILREVLAGAADYGYVTAEDVKFTVKDTGVIQKVEMKDDYTKLEITKADSVTNAGIPNTELSLYPVNDKGEVSEKAFVTATTDKDGVLALTYLPVGKYAVRETGTNFALGYVTAEDLIIEVKDTPKVQKYTMEDKHTVLELSKMDKETGKSVPGALLQVLNKDGSVVFEFETTAEDHFTYEYLPVGEYVLHEAVTPAGYVTAEDISFTVEDTENTQGVIMMEDFIKVDILKINAETGKPLPGAKMQLKEADGKIADSWTSTAQAKRFDRLPAGTYTLEEVNPPAGFISAEPMIITVEESGEVQKFIMMDAIKEGSIVIDWDDNIIPPEDQNTNDPDGTSHTNTADGNGPDTGDHSQLLAWLAVLLTSVSAAGFTAYTRPRRKEK